MSNAVRFSFQTCCNLYWYWIASNCQCIHCAICVTEAYFIQFFFLCFFLNHSSDQRLVLNIPRICFQYLASPRITITEVCSISQFTNMDKCTGSRGEYLINEEESIGEMDIKHMTTVKIHTSSSAGFSIKDDVISKINDWSEDTAFTCVDLLSLIWGAFGNLPEMYPWKM